VRDYQDSARIQDSLLVVGAGWLYKTLTKYSNAASFAEKSISVLNDLGPNMSIAAVYVLIGALCNYSSILGKLVKLDQAEEAGKQALALAEARLSPLDLEVGRIWNSTPKFQFDSIILTPM